MEKREFNIIGWGLAGAALAWELHKRGLICTIYDSGENHSSAIAAGLANPIVFKRLTKSWRVDDLLPYAHNHYRKVEDLTKTNFVTGKDILRIFASVEEENNWSVLQGDDRFLAYLGETGEYKLNGIDARFGYGRVKTFGNIDTKIYLDHSKAYLTNQGFSFHEHRFDYYNVDDQMDYIFCEGYEIERNIFFNYLPMKPAHGETITIKAPELKLDDVINKNMHIVPLGEGLFKLGATYAWEKYAPELTHDGLTELKNRFEAFCSVPYEVVEHKAGIRPTVPDRRPMLGTHPEEKNLHVFNGLGTKGVMIAPYFACMLIDHLIDGKPIEPEVNVDRHRKHFYR